MSVSPSALASPSTSPLSFPSTMAMTTPAAAAAGGSTSFTFAGISGSDGQNKPPASPAPSDSDPPAVLWVADRHRLVFRLLDILKSNPELRCGIWRHRGEPLPSLPKIEFFRQVARLLFTDEPGYPQAHNVIENHYGKAVKIKMWNLQSTYDKKAQELFHGGERIHREEDLPRESDTWRRWEHVRQDCPFFFQLQELCADRELDVLPHTVTPSRKRQHVNHEMPAKASRSRREEAITPARTPRSAVEDEISEVEEQLEAESRERIARNRAAAALAVVPFSHPPNRQRNHILPELDTVFFSVVLRGGKFEAKPPRGDFRYLQAWEDFLEWVRSLRRNGGPFTLEVKYKAFTKDEETLMILGVRKEGDEVTDRIYDQSSYNVALQSAMRFRRKEAPLIFVQVWVGEPGFETIAEHIHV
ncbi:hypothetical protein FN846DRAFT_960357 [Sphaerosporella brunnea]|uniref:Uncharacterized protein n=1 Tax=Sphaerosporella brunnea TaxID=1250544 RepID=A0A5J5ERH0_9PEZI|nr:hypothetical protein FN846DRAFT_960357 [Sphaerosporella brunnea]